MTHDDKDAAAQQAKAEALLRGAYALKTAADNVEYYREFAPIYDQQFATAMSYTYPGIVAAEFLKQHRKDGPVLDVGCGTGLVAEALNDVEIIDGVDISGDMIAVAEKKSVYRKIYRQDLTAGKGPLPVDYAGVVSAGTFTHGHLGPEVIDVLVDVGRPGCIYCIGINAVHYEQAGFALHFKQLVATQRLIEFEQNLQPIFNAADSSHAED